MKKIFNKVLSIFLALVMSISICFGLQFTAYSQTLSSSGQCGANATYTFNSSTGLLVITGTGSLYDGGGYIPVGDSSPFAYTGNVIKKVIIGNGITSLGNREFEDCYSLESITLPNTLKKIGFGAFWGCGLTSIDLPSGLTTISGYAFNSCTKLKTITIPDNVSNIGEYAFENCTNLSCVVLGKNTRTLSQRAFKGCSALKRIGIPKSFSKMNLCTFEGCSAIEDVYYGGSQSDWNKIDFDLYNSSITRGTIHYNSTSFSINGNIIYSTEEMGNTDLIFTPRKKDATASLSVANVKSLTEKIHPIIKSSLATANIKTFNFNDTDSNISVPYNDSLYGLVISADGYNDYIIPPQVAENMIYKTVKAENNKYSNYYETIFMENSKGNSKPYVSTVYAKSSNEDNVAYTNLVDTPSVFNINMGTPYDIIISGGNLSGSKTYYIGQNGNATISNSTGIFSSEVLSSKLKPGKKTYVWIVSENGTSKEVPLNVDIKDVESNEFLQTLRKGEYSIGGQNGISIKFPNDWVLVGGKSLDTNAFTAPVTVDYDPNECIARVGIGINIAEYNTESDYYGNDKSRWEFFKNEINGFSKQLQAIEKGLAKYKLQNILRKTGYSALTVSQAASEQKFKFDSSITGYIEATFCDGEFVLKEAAIVVDLGVKASFDGQYMAVVYGISGSADATVGGSASRTVLNNDDPIQWNINANITPGLKVYAGVGIQHVTSLDAYGLLKMPINWSFCDKSIDISLTGEVGIEAKVFIFSTSAPLISGTLGPKYFYYGKSDKSKASKLNFQNVDSNYDLNSLDVKLSNRDYNNETSSWLGNKSKYYIQKAKTLSQEKTIVNNLQTSVFDNSATKIISSNKTTLAVWIEDDSNRDTYNRIKLVYSVYDFEFDTWSEPKAVFDNGHMDAAPYLATNGDDIYIAWQKLENDFNSDNTENMPDILSNGEIYFAKYNDEIDCFENVTRLTNDFKYDYNPIITFENNNPFVYFCKSKDNSYCESDGNTIIKYDGNSVSNIASNLSTVFNLVGDTDGNIAYSVDTDGTMSTTNDISVFYGKSKFDLFEKSCVGSNMNMVYADFEGENTLFVSDGLNIYYFKNNHLQKVLEEDSFISGQLNAVKNQNKLTLFWTELTEFGNELFSCTFDGESWTGKSKITDRNNLLNNLSFACNNNRIIGIGNETLRNYNEKLESYENGSTNLIALKIEDFLDLSVNDVFLDERDLKKFNDNIPMNIVVENKGNLTVNNVNFSIKDKYGTNKNVTVNRTIKAGTTEEFEIEYTVPNGFNGGKIEVTVSNSDVSDFNSNDNYAYYNANESSLLITETSFTKCNELYEIDAIVSNCNVSAAKNVVLNAYFDNCNEIPFDTLVLGNINSNQYQSVTIFFSEDEIIEDTNGNKFVVLSVESDDSTTTLTVAIDESDMICEHPLTEFVEQVNATCTNSGLTNGLYCNGCNSYVEGGEAIAPLGHDYSIYERTVAPACVDKGYDIYKCSRCDLKENRNYIDEIGHDFSYSKTVLPTCIAQGYDLYTCSRCNSTEKRNTKNATGHSYVFTKTVTPTCTIQGYDLYTCSVCNGTEKRNTKSAIGHSYAFTKTVAPTCAAQGYDLYTCLVCNGTEKRNTVDATGHTYEEKSNTATCTDAGVKTTVCSKCGDTKTSNVSALGHSYNKVYTAPTCTEDGGYTNTCTRCGDITHNIYSASGHDYGECAGQEYIDKISGGSISTIPEYFNEFYNISSSIGSTSKTAMTSTNMAVPNEIRLNIHNLSEIKNYQFGIKGGIFSRKSCSGIFAYDKTTGRTPEQSAIPYTDKDGNLIDFTYVDYKVNGTWNRGHYKLNDSNQIIDSDGNIVCSKFEQTRTHIHYTKQEALDLGFMYSDGTVNAVAVFEKYEGIWFSAGIPGVYFTADNISPPMNARSFIDVFEYDKSAYNSIKAGKYDVDLCFYNPTHSGLSSTIFKIYDDNLITKTPATVLTDEKVTYTCMDCGETHTDTCELNIADFKIKTVSLSLESSITMNFKVLKSAIADFENPYVVFNCEGDELTVTDYSEQGDYYVFSYPGISPQLMNDDVKAVLHATHNDIDYTSPEKIMSVRTYAYTMLDRYSSDDYAELRTLLVDLLNYGAASQKYIGYQTDNLVNADLTDEQKAWGTNTTPTFENIRNYDYKTIANPTSKWIGSGLVLNNSVMVRAKFTADSIENKTVKITCGKGEFTYTKDDFVQDKDGNYYVYCNEIFANEMSEEILLTVYDNGVQCSNTMRFSIESYAKLVHDNYTGNILDELTTAMMRYGNSAKAYGA